MAPYVPKDRKREQDAITKSTQDAVNKARMNKDRQGEADAWTNGWLQLAAIADKTPKGTVVRNEAPSSLRETTVRDNNTGQTITAYFDPKAPPDKRYTASNGAPINMNNYTPQSTINVVESQNKEVLKSVIPTHTLDSKGEPVKINNHDQVVSAASQAFEQMGISARDPKSLGVMAHQGFQILDSTKKPITPDNMAMAIHASTIKQGADSTLKLIKGSTTNDKNAIRVATDEEQLRFAVLILSL